MLFCSFHHFNTCVEISHIVIKTEEKHRDQAGFDVNSNFFFISNLEHPLLFFFILPDLSSVKLYISYYNVRKILKID